MKVHWCSLNTWPKLTEVRPTQKPAEGWLSCAWLVLPCGWMHWHWTRTSLSLSLGNIKKSKGFRHNWPPSRLAETTAKKHISYLPPGFNGKMGLLRDDPVENNIRIRSNNYTCHSPPNHHCRRNLYSGHLYSGPWWTERVFAPWSYSRNEDLKGDGGVVLSCWLWDIWFLKLTYLFQWSSSILAWMHWSLYSGYELAVSSCASAILSSRSRACLIQSGVKVMGFAPPPT